MPWQDSRTGPQPVQFAVWEPKSECTLNSLVRCGHHFTTQMVEAIGCALCSSAPVCRTVEWPHVSHVLWLGSLVRQAEDCILQ